MKLAEYDDEELIEEIKHRGLKIEVICSCNDESQKQDIKIGGIKFDIK